MQQLVAVDLPGGPGFVEALQRIWDDGDVALPLDRRAPGTATTALLAEVEAHRIVDSDGERALDSGGEPMQVGDALVMATSGSTGTPKGVVLTHDAIAASARSTTNRLGTGPDDTWLACLPLSHVGGLAVVTRALITGSRLVVHDGFDASAVKAVARRTACAVALVSTALRRVDPSVFRVIVLGGSRQSATPPVNAVVTYGLTETGSGAVYDGRPLDGVEVRVADDGEIHLRGPMLMRGYRGRSAPPSPIDGDGWLSTGDLGEIMADGRLSVHGRRGDLIVTGGENVWPQVVEEALATEPSVADVCVAGVDDLEWGQRVVAWVVPSVAGDLPTLDALRARLRTTLPAFMAPKEMRIVDAIPRTALGKPARELLP